MGQSEFEQVGRCYVWSILTFVQFGQRNQLLFCSRTSKVDFKIVILVGDIYLNLVGWHIYIYNQ